MFRFLLMLFVIKLYIRNDIYKIFKFANDKGSFGYQLGL